MHRRRFLGAATAALVTPWSARAETFAVTKTDEEWRARLSPIAYAILRGHGTEELFSNSYHDEKSSGTYHCVGCDSPVYASADKYASGTGWPAFDRAIPG